MKRIILSFIILLAAQMVFAQEEVAIEQRVDQRINELIVNPGWDVHLLHQEADSGFRIAIITDEDLAARAYNVQLCNVKGDTLTILENTQLPQGTVVEVEGNMDFESVKLEERAVVRANQFNLGRTYVEVYDDGRLCVDTIVGEGKLSITLYGGKFEYGVNRLKGEIVLSDYKPESNTWSRYQYSWPKIIKTEMVDGEFLTKERYKIWSNSLSLNGAVGVRQGDTPKDANSPLLQNNTVSFKLGFDTYFRISNRWGGSTGIMWNGNRKALSHQVKYENNKLEVIDGQGDYQRNALISNYLGIPVTLYYYLGKQQTESLSLDFYFARLFGERLTTSADPTRVVGFGWTGESVDNIFNPWKLEAGLSFNTRHLGVIHGIRVFTNLLPEYKPGVTTDKVRSVGVEIKL